MAMLGKQIKTVYISKPNEIKAPEPREAQAFEINIPEPTSIMKRLVDKVKIARTG